MQRPRWIRQVKLRNNLTGRVTSLPMMCQHCEHPPCVDVCPTGASFRRADGIVMVDRHTCIGCRYCMMACPYKARSFIHENVDIKTTVGTAWQGLRRVLHPLRASSRQRRGHDGLPGGLRAVAPIIFGDLKDPNSEVSQALAKYPDVRSARI